VRTTPDRDAADGSTFTQQKRRDQFVHCMIDLIADVGFARASVGELARCAGVSKGVVTYHFPAKDDLIRAVIADVIDSMEKYLTPRLLAAEPTRFPERFIAAYVTSWAAYYRSHARQVLALVRIFNAFRDDSGSPNPAFGLRVGEVAALEQVLRAGQDMGRLGSFDARVVASVIKASVDDLLTQFVNNPDLDLEGHAAELVALFERATRPDPANRHPAAGPRGRPADSPASAGRRQPDEGGSHDKDC
jgi:TetR/AcrR family transcriptional regulator, fatty acid metabolism regulator protein